ncbi:hypothetical protein B0H15DRAFT_945957 [Mycena belliarum]|uniref:Zn(2)-C6 fungal-type domain-containing protein n=1 Tax=Mycena belliarum TaxID=1033014 RepID=A0AAD6UAT4_9AGAR|nr:hypothetical protein B0H15DRAFT_945957 [Mycena belliae]
MTGSSHKRKHRSSSGQDDAWINFRNCPNIDRIISYLDAGTLKKANLTVAEQAYTHFVDAVRDFRKWCKRDTALDVEALIYAASLSLFQFCERVRHAAPAKPYAFRELYLDMQDLAPECSPSRVPVPTALFKIPPPRSTTRLPPLPAMDERSRISSLPVPSTKRVKLETAFQQSSSGSASRTNVPRGPPRRAHPNKSLIRVEVPTPSTPSVSRPTRPLPTPKVNKGPPRSSLPSLPPDIVDVESEDEPRQDPDDDQDQDEDAERDADHDTDQDPMDQDEEEPPEEPQAVRRKSKGKQKEESREPSPTPTTRSDPANPADALTEAELDTLGKPESTPLVVPRQHVGAALPFGHYDAALFPCTECHSFNEQCFERGPGVACLPCAKRGIKCSHEATGVQCMLLQERAEKFTAGGSSALIARLAAILQARRQVDLFRALTTHAFHGFNEALHLVTLRTIIARLKLTRQQLNQEFRPRPVVHERAAPADAEQYEIDPFCKTYPPPATSSDWIDSPGFQEFLTGPQDYSPALPARAAPRNLEVGPGAPLTADSDPELFRALARAAPAPPKTPPLSSLDAPEPSTPIRPSTIAARPVPPSVTVSRPPRPAPSTPGPSGWAGRAPLQPPAYAPPPPFPHPRYPYYPGYLPPGSYGPGSPAQYYAGPPPPSLGPSPLAASAAPAPSPSPKPPSDAARPPSSPKPPVGQSAPSSVEESAGTGEFAGTGEAASAA